MPNIDDPSNVGDFSKPVVRPKDNPVAARLDALTPKATPVEERLEAADAKLAEEADRVDQSLKPKQSYEERLKEVGISKEDAAHIVDSMLEKGFYEEKISITSRLSIKLRTRQYRDTERFHNVLEAVRPVFADTQNELKFKYCLAASLAEYRDTKFSYPSKSKASKEDIEKAFDQRMAFIEEMSDPVLRVLYAKLQAFDLKIAIVCEEGAIENF